MGSCTQMPVRVILRKIRRQNTHRMPALRERRRDVGGVPLGPATGGIGVQNDQSNSHQSAIVRQ